MKSLSESVSSTYLCVEGKEQIIVSEIPFDVNKAMLVHRIADLSMEKKLDGILEVRDESDRDGLRIVIELKRDANPNVVLNLLYKHTLNCVSISSFIAIIFSESI